MTQGNPSEPTFYKPKKLRDNFIVDILQTVIIALTISVVIYLVIAIPNQVDGQSMEPNFHDHELLLTNKVIEWFGESPVANTLHINYDYERGDVIIFHFQNEDLIKRVIAKSGDTVRIQDNKVFVNGKQLDEKYIPTTTRTRMPFSAQASFEDAKDITVPDGKNGCSLDSQVKTEPTTFCYFVMGDNRENSKDSRFREVGFVARGQVKGRVFFRYWPLDKFGIIRKGEFQEITPSQP